MPSSVLPDFTVGSGGPNWSAEQADDGWSARSMTAPAWSAASSDEPWQARPGTPSWAASE